MKFFTALSILLALALTSCDSSNSAKTVNPSPVGAAPSPVSEPVPLQKNSKTNVVDLNGAQAVQITLENNLKVTLISSPTSKKSAAAVAVKVGHKDNPIEAQGLAHYLEHMLFLGTEKFPIVNDYKNFLSKNNGGYNAYTSNNHTNYFLEVRTDKFEEAVDRLSSFFVSPTFDAEYIEKEKSAVHNEFNLRFEAFKPNRVFSAFTKEAYKGRLFPVGNKETLRDTTAEDTRVFFKEHYYTENMHATLAGPQTLEELEVLARKYFADVRSKPGSKIKVELEFDDMNFDLLPAMVRLKPQGAQKELSVFVPVINPKKVNKSILSILGSLLGDESADSLMVKLQEAGLARQGSNAVSGGVGVEGISITVKLSDKGVESKEEVLSYILGYLNFLTQKGLPSYANKEVSKAIKAAKSSASFYEVSTDTVSGVNRTYIAGDTIPETIEELFFGKTIEPAQSQEYKEFLTSLDWSKILVRFTHPDNLNLEYEHSDMENLAIGGLKVKKVLGKKLVLDSLYKFAYEVEDIDVDSIQPKGAFTLKKENVYLPEDLAVYSDKQPEVYTRKTFEGGFVHYNALTSTKLPKAFLNLEILNGKVKFSNNKEVASLFVLKELLGYQTKDLYPMLTAGFVTGFSINPTNGSLGFAFSGWSDTFQKALNDYLGATNLRPSVEEFEKVKKIYSEKIKIQQAGSVTDIGVNDMRAQIEPARLTHDETQKELAALTHNEFLAFTNKYTSSLHVRGALSGNIKESFVSNTISTFTTQWGAEWAEEISWGSLYELQSVMGQRDEKGELPLFETSIEGNHPEENFYYGYLSFGEKKNKKEALVAKVLGSWLAPDFSSELRSNRGLAYGLGAWNQEHMDVLSLGFYLQSSTHLIDDIESQVDGYIQTWAEEVLPAKTDSLLQATKNSYLLNQKMPSEPSQLHEKYYSFVLEGYSTVDEYQKELESLDSITVQDVVDFGQKNLLKPKTGSFIKVSRKKQ